MGELTVIALLAVASSEEFAYLVLTGFGGIACLGILSLADPLLVLFHITFPVPLLVLRRLLVIALRVLYGPSLHVSEILAWKWMRIWPALGPPLVFQFSSF